VRFMRLAGIAIVMTGLFTVAPLGAEPIATPSIDIAQTPPVASPAATSTISGTILDASTNQPIGGVAVTAEGGGSRFGATTASDGTFSVVVPPGFYDVDANKGGFQSAQVTGVAVALGTVSSVKISLAEANSNSLRTITRVSVSRANALNTSTSDISTLGVAQIQQRDLPNLSDVVAELPGVTLLRSTGATANAFFVVHGGDAETRVNIDGHPLSVGTFGNYNTNYAIGDIFDQVEVLKGPGLNGPNAGESAFGTINLRTRDFSPHDYAEIKGGLDNLDGSFFSAFGQVNLFNDRLSILAGKAVSGYRGPYDDYVANRINTGSGLFGPITPGLGEAPTFPGLIQWQGDFSNRYGLEGELAKARYRFSSATSITAEFLGLEGQYYPQGGSYGSFYGYETVAPCYNGSTPGSVAATDCTAKSTYNAPYAQGQIGQSVPVYSWFPNSYIQNNEPEFSAEFRTSLKNDTFLLRPYAALVDRFISGANENRYPGNDGGWYEVTSAANCQATFVAPTATGAKGPCFANGFTNHAAPSYIGSGPQPSGVVYPTTAAAPTCSAAVPCWTTPTAYQANGLVGYGSPFSQPEIDRLHGTTFQYIHPVHDNLYGFSYDYNADDTYSTTGDTTTPLAGCTPVIGSSVSNVINAALPATASNLRQPTCALGIPTTYGTAGGVNANGLPGTSYLPVSEIAIPPTIIRKQDFAATAQLQITPKLASALGLYYTNYRSDAQTENPKVLAQYAALGLSSAAPVALADNFNVVDHVDPHIGFTYRVNPSLVLRATGGSSITTPYASLISGLGRIDLPNGSNNGAYTLTLANSSLKPESTVAYDVGFDYRLPDTSVFTTDVYDNTVHNIFASVTTEIAPIAGITAPGGFFQSETINGPIGRYYGVDVGLSKSLPVGFGYTLEGSLERAYLDQLPRSIYTSQVNLIDGKQLDGSVNGQGSIPYAKGYAEIRYAGIRNSLFAIGMDYEGNNNSTYGPAYTLFNGTVRFELAPGVAFQTSVDNLFNLNTGTDLARGLFNQGTKTLTLGPGTVPGTLVTGSRTKSLQEVDFKTYRFSLAHRF
jgi:outer membrane receptor protein involved in Fe transport